MRCDREDLPPILLPDPTPDKREAVEHARESKRISDKYTTASTCTSYAADSAFRTLIERNVPLEKRVASAKDGTPTPT